MIVDHFACGWLRHGSPYDSNNASTPERPAIAISSLRDGTVGGWTAPPEEAFLLRFRTEKSRKGEELSDLGATTAPREVDRVLEIPQSPSRRPSVEVLRHSHRQIEELFLIAPDGAAIASVRRAFRSRSLLGVKFATGRRAEALVAPEGE